MEEGIIISNHSLEQIDQMHMDNINIQLNMSGRKTEDSLEREQRVPYIDQEKGEVQ